MVGITRTLEVPSPQTLNGTTYDFDRWSDGAARRTRISTPATATTYTAFFREVTGGDGLSATYYDNQNLTGTTANRVDSTVDFVWGAARRSTGIAADTFSVRWAGAVQPPATAPIRSSPRATTASACGSTATWSSTTGRITRGRRTPARSRSPPASGTRCGWSSTRTGATRSHGCCGAGPSVAKAVVPRSSLFSRFGGEGQLPTRRRPPYRPATSADTGAVFGLRSGGERFGWNADNSAQTRDRNAANSADQRYDTLTHLQKPAEPNAVWELAVPNGTYTVRVVAGDASHVDSVFRLNVEGVLSGERHAERVDSLVRGHVER